MNDISKQKQRRKTMQPTDGAVLRALKDSRPHWLANASVDDLKDAKTSASNCKLCGIFYCKGGREICSAEEYGKCPLSEKSNSICACCIEYRISILVLGKGNLPEFHQASLKMVERLDKEIAKLEE